MNGKNLLIGLSCIDRKYIEESEQDMPVRKTAACAQRQNKAQPKRLSVRKVWLIAAVIAFILLLVGCAVVCATILFGSPAEMISALYGEKTGFDSAPPTEVTEPRNNSVAAWTVPGYEKLPVEETVSMELEKRISPVGKSITADGYKLTVDAYLYDSNTQCGLITMLLEHEKPISDEELLVGYTGEIGGLSGNYLNINQYGRAYLIPEKTTDSQLAFTYYFRADMRTGTNLTVSFPDFEQQARFEEYERNRTQGVAAIRQRLKEELTAQEAAAKLTSMGRESGYTGEYDDFYFLAALEYDSAHADALMSRESMELSALNDQLRSELSSDEAVQKLRSLWGDALVDETFANQMDELPSAAYCFLARRTYEQAHMEEMVCVSLPDSGNLPYKTFGQGDAYVNSLCIRIKTTKFAASPGCAEKVVFHMTDGTDFVVIDSLTDNTLFIRAVENGDTLYMLNSAINIDKIQSVEVVGELASAALEADTK